MAGLRIPSESEIRSLKMIDDDLVVSSTEIGQASHPDESLTEIRFKMMNTISNEEMGQLSLRIGYNSSITLYRGNLGFSVKEKFRGHHYSSRSSLLLVPLLKSMNFSPVWLTCNEDNGASRCSIERIGARF